MAGGRGASSSCQDRGWTRAGEKGEKLSSVTSENPPSAEDSAVSMCVSTLCWQVRELVSGCWAACVSDWEGGISGVIAPGGPLGV